jgi:O-antigen/teichoic acid export membrane protein
MYTMFREILNTIGTKIASAIIALLILILTTQYLGADGRGLVSLIYSSIGIIGIFAGFVGGPAVIYLASKKKMQYLILPIYAWAVVIAILGAGVVWILQIVPDIYILPIAILAITSSIFVVNLYLLVGRRKVQVNNSVYIFQWIANLIILGYFFTIIEQPYVEYVVIALFISNIGGLALTFYELKKIADLTPFQWSEEMEVIRLLVSFSFYAQAALVMYYLYFRLGIFLLNSFSGLSATGIYSVGVNIAEFILLASQSIALVAYSRISNKDDYENSKNLTITLTKFSFLITFGITLVILLLPAGVFGLIFGKDFSSVNAILLTMCPGIIAFGTTIIIFNFFAGIGKNQVNAIAALVGLCVNVILSYLLIPLYGPYGAGIAASGSYILMAIVLTGVFLIETNTRLEEFIIHKSDFVYLCGKFREGLFSQKQNESNK